MDGKRLEIDVLMLDGTEHRVLTCLADRIQWDVTAAKKKWPDMQHALSLWPAFLAWAAMCRQGLYDQPFEHFQMDVQGVDVHNDADDDAEDDAVGPTVPVRSVG